MDIHYCLDFSQLHKKLIEVSLDFESTHDQHISLPAWIPGSYMIRDFARNIVSLDAFNATGHALSVTKLDKQTWRLNAARGKVRIVYTVYANDLSVRSAHVDNRHVFFNGTSLFLRVDGQEQANCVVEIRQPPQGYAESWRVATTLPDTDIDQQGYGHYKAENYARLIDHPVEIADLTRCEFTVAGIQHEMVFSGRHDSDLQRLESDLPPILEEHVALFGELPVARYLFMTTVTSDGYGGLEHRDSTALICSRKELPSQGMEKPAEDYQRYLGLCSHEYFHLWNVKRIQPAALQDTRLDSEVHTPLLWAFEGITSYYDDLALLRSGAIEPADYLKLITATVTRVMRGAGRNKQSVAESSFDAWTKFYKQDENATNAIVSYYAKGSLVALGLDVELRLASEDGVCLDDVMRLLWQRYGREGRGVEDATIQGLCEELVGQSMDTFFSSYVYGTVELPLERWFAALGIGFRLRPQTTNDDTGSALDTTPEALPEAKTALGAVTAEHPVGARLAVLYEDSMAQQAGLAAGDLVIAVNGLQVNHATLRDVVAALPAGSEVTIHAIRDGLLDAYSAIAEPSRQVSCDLWLIPDDTMTAAVKARFKSWRSSRR